MRTLYESGFVQADEVVGIGNQPKVLLSAGPDGTHLNADQVVELASALVDWAQQQTHSHALYVAAQYLDQYQAHPEGDPA